MKQLLLLCVIFYPLWASQANKENIAPANKEFAITLHLLDRRAKDFDLKVSQSATILSLKEKLIKLLQSNKIDLFSYKYTELTASMLSFCYDPPYLNTRKHYAEDFQVTDLPKELLCFEVHPKYEKKKEKTEEKESPTKELNTANSK